MRVLVCGTRHLDPTALDSPAALLIGKRLWQCPEGSVLIHGGANGVDVLAARLARGSFMFDAVLPFYADWKKHGRAAGPIRNQRMLDEGKPELVLAFHTDPKLGRGTADMVRRARAAGVPVEVHILPEATHD